MKAVLTNLSRFGRDAWFDVSVPLSLFPAKSNPVPGSFWWLRPEDGGSPKPAILLGVEGHLSVRFLVRATLPALGELVGDLIRAPFRSDVPPADVEAAAGLEVENFGVWSKFLPSSWVADDLGAIFLSVSAVVDAIDLEFKLDAVDLIEANAAQQVWRVTRRVGSLVLVVDYLVRSLSDVVEFEGYVVASNPAIEDPTTMVRRFSIESREPMVVDFAVRNRFSPIYVLENGTVRERWCCDLIDIDEELPIGEGQGFEFYGAILARPKGASIGDLAVSTDPEVRRRLDNLVARADGGRAFGISKDWTEPGAYVPFGYLPPAKQIDRTRAVREATAAMLEPAGIFADRPLGLGRYTGQTGTQDDFGAAKSSEVLVDLLAPVVPWLRWNVEETVRPIHYREESGHRIALSRHPDWWTHSQRTHASRSQSPDRLGKSGPGETNGWHGKDDQHASGNRIHAIRAILPTTPTRLALLDEETAAIRNSRLNPRSSDGIGGTRAVGRRMHAEVLRFFALGSERSWATVVEEARVAWEKSLGARLDPGLPVRVIEADLNGDPRKLDGSAPYWTVWEHGLALLGLAAAHAALSWRRDRPTFAAIEGEDRIEALAEMVLRTMLFGAFFRSTGGAWQTWQDIRYRLDIEGQALEPAVLIEGGYGETHGRIDRTSRAWADWIVPGLIYFARHPSGSRSARGWLGADGFARLESIVEDWSVLPKGRSSSEWRATAPSRG